MTRNVLGDEKMEAMLGGVRIDEKGMTNRRFGRGMQKYRIGR